MGPPNPIYDLDSRLRDLQAAVEDVVTTARAEHSRLCREELLLFTSFMHNEGISRADSFSSLVSLFTAAKPLLGNAIQDLAWMREERRDLHEKYKNSLEENIKEVHLQLVGHAVESGRRSLLEDAATKMEQTICASNATEKTTGQRSVALSVLFRYPELMQGRVLSGSQQPDLGPTPPAEKRRFAFYLLLAEKEKARCPQHSHIRSHLEVLFQWTWGMSIQATSEIRNVQFYLDDQSAQQPSELLSNEEQRETDIADEVVNTPIEGTPTGEHVTPDMTPRPETQAREPAHTIPQNHEQALNRERELHCKPQSTTSDASTTYPPHSPAGYYPLKNLPPRRSSMNPSSSRVSTRPNKTTMPSMSRSNSSVDPLSHAPVLQGDASPKPSGQYQSDTVRSAPVGKGRLRSRLPIFRKMN